MKHLHLLVPDLFLPQDMASEVHAGLRLPSLQRLLARGNFNTRPGMELENSLCQKFSAEGIAPVRAVTDGLEPGENYWLCADPVSLQLQRAQMLLLPDVILTQEEADTLCAMLNEHFKGMGIFFVAPHPLHWYVRLDSAPDMTTTPLNQAAWHDARFYQPQGSEALHWQRIATEIQMLLYEHPVNQARAARGDLVVSSLWLWGGGHARPVQSAFDVVGGDSELADIFAHAADKPKIDSVQEFFQGSYASALWVGETLRAAYQRGDLYTWREAIQQFDQKCARPVLKALQTGRLQHLTLEALQANERKIFELTRRDVWKIWRATRPLARYGV